MGLLPLLPISGMAIPEPIDYLAGLTALAFDPGGTTGCALHTPDGTITTFVVEDGKYESVLAFITPLVDIVIYERFASSQATSHYAIFTIELCGAIQGRVWALNDVMKNCGADPDDCRCGIHRDHKIKLVRHEPQNRKGFLNEATAFVHTARKASGVQLGKLAVHEYDALAHLLAYQHFGDDLHKRQWGKGISNA